MTTGNMQVIEVDILDEVYIDPEINNREVLDDTAEVESLANSIENTDGLLQAIVVYPTPDSRRAEHGKMYELGSGYRRCAALKHLAETTGEMHWVRNVPANVKEEASVSKRHIHQLIENLQRKDLKQMEVALAFQKALNDKAADLTLTELARQIAWPLPTVSNFVRVANALLPEVQSKVMSGEIPWSSAKEMASAVVKHKISETEQKTLASAACGMSTAEFKERLDSLYNNAEESGDEAEKKEEVSTGNEGSQRTYNAIRSSQLEKKYIPKLEEMKKSAKTPAEQSKIEHYLDAIKFVLQVEGTDLGSTLAPWEKQLEEEAMERKAAEEETRLETQYVRKAVSEIKKELKKIPPATLEDGTPNPHREAPTLPQVLASVQASVVESLKKGKEAGLEENQMTEGFKVASVDDFIKKINDAYVESVKKDKEAAERRAAALEKKKLEAEQAKSGSETAEGGESVAETAEV